MRRACPEKEWRESQGHTQLSVLKGLDGEPKPPSALADFVQQLLHQNNCKIDPCGIEFMMMIPRPSGFGNVVARGLNLCVPIVSLLLLVVKIVLQLTKNSPF
jgi:hypothetical protein